MSGGRYSMMKAAMLILKIALYSLTIIFFFSFFLIYINSHPPRYDYSALPSQFGVKFENVQFEAEDGVMLRGWFVPASAGAADGMTVIVCHGLGANKSDFTALAAYLSGAGFHVLLFDFRAHGESGGSRTSFGFLEKKDLLAAIKFLEGREEVDKEKIGIYGFSMGAATAILTASETRTIKAVVSDSAFITLKDQGIRLLTSAYGKPFKILIHPLMWAYRFYFAANPGDVSPEKYVNKLSPRPILIIGGERDEQMPASDAERLYTVAGEPKELWIVPGAQHGGTFYASGKDYFERVGEFFNRHLVEDLQKSGG